VQASVHTPHTQLSAPSQSSGASHVRIQLVFVPSPELSVVLAHPNAVSRRPAAITNA
jgi:hypothetical protein